MYNILKLEIIVTFVCMIQFQMQHLLILHDNLNKCVFLSILSLLMCTGKIVSVKSLRMAATAATETTSKLEAIPSVDIDVGRFKYVLIRVDHVDPEMKKEYSKVIVRGYLWAAFHGEVYHKYVKAF